MLVTYLHSFAHWHIHWILSLLTFLSLEYWTKQRLHIGGWSVGENFCEDRRPRLRVLLLVRVRQPRHGGEAADTRRVLDQVVHSQGRFDAHRVRFAHREGGKGLDSHSLHIHCDSTTRRLDDDNQLGVCGSPLGICVKDENVEGLVSRRARREGEVPAEWAQRRASKSQKEFLGKFEWASEDCTS